MSGSPGVAHLKIVSVEAEAPCAPPTTAPGDSRPARSRETAAALQAVAAHDGATLVDFDETLFLRNSTECFIDCAWPGPLALMLLCLLDLLKPWRFSGSEATRDNWRVGVIAVVMPWTWLRWARRAPQLAAAYTNRPLLQALRANDSGHKTIVSLGFSRIIGPLARAMGAADLRLVGSRIFHASDRRFGKLALCEAAFGEALVAQALVITDSPQDLPLLKRCHRGWLVQWPEARFEAALRQAYLPGQYISRVKHPGQRYILRAILQEDFTLWLLASVALAFNPLWHSAGLLLLLVSFWAIYEQGYADNDRCGALHEDSPKLSQEFFTEQTPPRVVEPWLWATACGALGIIALHYPLRTPPADFLRWAAVLVATSGLFRLYNRVDKSTRVWLYSGLQFARGAAFVAVAAVPPVGVAALGAHVFARWIPYYFYRQGAQRWLTGTFHLVRLVLFFWMAVLLGLTGGTDGVVTWTGAALLAWNVLRARRELATAWRTAYRIDRHSKP